MTNFFYDKQIRRYISQIVSVFSYFEVEFGVIGIEDESLTSIKLIKVC